MPLEQRVACTVVTTTATQRHLTRRALWLAVFTVVYNLAEGVLAVVAGLAAGLVSVVGFGFDSGIESASAVLLGLRLVARLRDGEHDERRERLTLRAIALTFFALAAYVVVEGVRELLVGERPDASPLGVAVLLASLIVMPVLVALKVRVGRRLGDRLILADAAETRVCILLSVSTLAGLLVYQFTGAWWADPVAGFVIAAFAIREGREAWEGDLEDD